MKSFEMKEKNNDSIVNVKTLNLTVYLPYKNKQKGGGESDTFWNLN